MKPIRIFILAALALLAAFLVYRALMPSSRLDVDPHAAHEIDKATKR